MGRNVWIVKPGTNSKGSGIETPSGKNILLLVFCWSFFVAVAAVVFVVVAFVVVVVVLSKECVW